MVEARKNPLGLEQWQRVVTRFVAREQIRIQKEKDEEKEKQTKKAKETMATVLEGRNKAQPRRIVVIMLTYSATSDPVSIRRTKQICVYRQLLLIQLSMAMEMGCIAFTIL